MSHLRPVVALVAAALLLPAAGAQAKTTQQLYVSLGDSYAAGYQPTGVGTGATTREGFAYQVPALAKKRGYALKLVNFGCGGATTTSMLKTKGCRPKALGPGGTSYAGKTQMAAAEAFLRKNKSKVALVTVSIGGNDVTSCAKAADPITCTAGATQTLSKNVTTIAKRLRKAAGKKVRIVGTTYPDVLLGEWLKGDAGKQLAQLSVGAFQGLINPNLKTAYEAAGGKLVDVTTASGSYVPFDQTTTLAPYGTVPAAVAKVCELTWYCKYNDIHANKAGYAIIADLVAKTLPRR